MSWGWQKMKTKQPHWMGSVCEAQEVGEDYGNPRAHPQEGGGETKGGADVRRFAMLSTGGMCRVQVRITC